MAFRKPQAGIHKMKIVEVDNVKEKQYLRLLLDWADGEFEDFGSKTEERFGNKWSYVTCIMSYKETCQKAFSWKMDTLALENGMMKNEWRSLMEASDYQKLVGFQAYFALNKETYTNKNGEEKEAWSKFPDLLSMKDLDKAQEKIDEELKARVAEPAEGGASTDPFASDEALPF